MTARPVHLTIRDGVAVAVIDHPPVNALGHPVRAGLWAALDAVEADPAIAGLVIRAQGRTWPPGADIREFAVPPKPPILTDLCDRIEASGKPVVVLLHGTVLGGGLELAMAAQARLSLPDASFGLPEVTLGLCPGAGGTRRLPALIGAKAALGLMLTGLPVSAEAAEGMGLIDAIAAPEDGEALALGLVKSLAVGTPAPPTRPDDPASYMAAVSEARAGLREVRLPAPSRIIDCVEAALLLPPDAASRFERAAFADLAATPQSRALRHVFFAERRAGRSETSANSTAVAPPRVAVTGDGPDAATLAVTLAASATGVTFLVPGPAGDSTSGAVAQARARIAAAGVALATSGRFGPDAKDRMTARIAVTADPADLDGCGAALALGAEAAAPGAILPASCPIAICDAAEAAGFRAAVPEASPRTFGFLPFPSIARGRLVEITAPDPADAGALATLCALVRRMGRSPVITKAPVGAALAAAYFAASDRAVEEGATPAAIDGTLVHWGFLQGPFALRDRLGLDRAPPPPPGSVTETLWLSLMEEGRIGRVTGAGFFRYHRASAPSEPAQVDPASDPLPDPDPDLDAKLAAARTRAGRVARAVSNDEIIITTLAALAATGARLVDGGVVARPSDLDVMAIGVLGFPRWRGGPMQAVDEAGLLSIRNLLRDLSHEDQASPWDTCPLWDRLIRNGQRFADLNG